MDDALADDAEQIVHLAAAHPWLRFVHLVRHPFAVIASSTRSQRDTEEHWTTVNGDIVDAAERAGTERFLIVRWEEAVADPAALAARLAGFAGLAVDTRAPGGSPSPELPDPAQRVGRATRALAVELGYPVGAFDAVTAAPDTATAETPSIRRAASGGRAPASPAQQRLLFIEALDPGLAVHHLPSVKRITGPLDVAAMRAAIDAVVRRHEALRTDFELVDGQWMQVVAPPTPIGVPVDDLRDVPSEQRDAAVEVAIATELGRPFDLAAGPKIRARLLRTGTDEHVLVVTIHHIAADGSSMVRITDEVGAGYEAAVAGTEPSLPLLPVRYTDVSLWQHQQLAGGTLAHQLERWRQRLSGPLPVLELPTDRPRPPVFAFAAGSVPIHFPGALSIELRAVARRSGVTPFMFLLASYAATLARWTDADDVVIGTATANRRPETEHLVGLFASTLPLRVRVDRHAPFQVLLDEVKRTTLSAFADEDVPFDRIVHTVNPPRHLSRAPIFQTMFVLNNMRPAAAHPVAGILVDDVDFTPSAVDVDLSVVLDESPAGFAGRADFAAALWDEATIERFVNSWYELLSDAVADPATAVGELTVVPAADRDLLLARWNDTAAPLPPYERIESWFTAQAGRTPDAPAVGDTTSTMTYAALDAMSNRVAAHLAACGVAVGDRVGIAVERSTATVAVLLGILKAGAAYVPLDPRFPESRLDLMVADSRLKLVVTSGPGVAERFTRDGGPAVVDLEVDRDALDSADAGPRPTVAGDDAVAYVVYTSGSTGVPKGVVVGHRGVVNFLGAMQRTPGMTPDDVLVAVTTLSFDISVLELLLPLVTGASVVVADQDEVVDGRLLADLVDRVDATVLQATPTTWAMLLEAGWRGRPGLRVLCGGEAMPVGLAERLVAGCGPVWNMFGPTETTIWSTILAVTPDEIDAATSGVLAIGRPIANTVCRVLDAAGNLAPIGVAGELLIGGAGLAHGYHDRPELTAERFIADPFAPGQRLYRTGDLVRWRADGALEFLGRIDGQVKLRGHRIEVGEIESVLRAHPAVTDAAVVVDGAGAASRLVGYVTTSPEGVDAAELRAYAGERLPGYMVPAMFVTLDAFPTTPNRKLDRRALPAPGRAVHEQGVAPRDALEARLAGWFATVLERPEVGIYDNFFDLGGYSLLATRLFAIVEQETGRRIPVSALFKAPTVEALAQVIRTGLPASQWTSMVPIQTAGTAVPFFYVVPYMISVLELARLGTQLGTDQPLYGFQPQGLDGTSPIHHSIEAMAAHYIAEMKSVQPLGPYRIGGHCSGTWVAFEMARQLEASGDQLDVVLLVDQGPPGVSGDLPSPLVYYLKRIAFYLRDGRLLPALRWQMQIRMRRRVLRRMAPRTIGVEEAVHAAHYAAHCKYVGGIVHHDLALVLSDESTMLDDKAWYLEWRTKTTGEMHVRQTRGTHANLLKPGYVDDLADCVRWAFGPDDRP